MWSSLSWSECVLTHSCLGTDLFVMIPRPPCVRAGQPLTHFQGSSVRSHCRLPPTAGRLSYRAACLPGKGRAPKSGRRGQGLRCTFSDSQFRSRRRSPAHCLGTISEEGLPVPAERRGHARRTVIPAQHLQELVWKLPRLFAQSRGWIDAEAKQGSRTARRDPRSATEAVVLAHVEPQSSVSRTRRLHL